jgi:glycerol-1-phosphate dehydrogenase [NAD(P)+]
VRFAIGVLNVDVMEIGAGALRRVRGELARGAVLTMPPPWQAVLATARIEPAQVVMLESIEETVLDRLAGELRGVPQVAGVGGGVAIDAAKYVAWKLGVPCISVPTTVSTTAFANATIGIRRRSQIAYVGDAEARTRLLVVDLDVIGAAPRQLNVAGAADLLAIHTACVDWEIAWASGVTEHPPDPVALEQARDIVRFVINRADVIRRMDGRAIKLLVDLSLEAVEIESGHPRMGEGSEHFLVYLLERLTGRMFQHGAVVGLAIDVVSALQADGWHDRLCGALDAIGLGYTPRDLELAPAVVRKALERLPDYVVEEGYWYSVVDATGVLPGFVDTTLERLRF